jgi:hypothetical protein
MSFLSQPNAQYITEILYNFLKDKHNIQLFEVASEGVYKQMLSSAMVQTNQTYGKQYNETDLTKIVIRKLKETILEMASNVKPVETVQPIPIEEASETEFINKLQQLEFQRQNINLSMPPPNQMNEIKPAEMIYNHPQSTTYPLPQTQQTNTTVYIPSAAKVGTEVTISSWQRDWMNYPERNGFTWKGPLPPFLDITNVKLGCLILPLPKKQCPSILSIFIEGPNEKDVHIKVILDKVFDSYGIYKPITDSLSYLYLLALPWKINLETIDGEPLYLGRDRIEYKILSNGPAASTIQVPDSNLFKVFDNIRICSNNKVILPSMVLSVEDNKLVIQGTFQNDGYLLLFDKQFTLVLETHSTVSKN